MAIKLYDTLSREKKELKPIHDDWVGLYTCGPTVYNFAHIGNLRTYIFEDILQRALEYNGYNVRRVMNITDVGHLTNDSDAGEEKMDNAAKAEKKSVQEIAQFYTDAFFEDLEKLNIKKPDIIAPATYFINDQISLIETLFQNGFAYNTPNAVYFDVSKLKDYGKLSGQSLDEKMIGARGEVVVDTEKRNAADFALWFKLEGKFKNHLLHWPSPWGDGFPGWHIECSAISRHFLGQPFDIHTGGVDHIGTHHTNEIAQSEAAFGVPLANIWMHGEHLLVNEAKMAKSEADKFITLSTLEEKGYSPLVFRYLVLGAHYRTKLNFTWESLEAARNGLENLYQKIKEVSTFSDENLHEYEGDREGWSTPYENQFQLAVDDDLNMSRALALAHTMLGVKTIPHLERLNLIKKFDRILGLNLADAIQSKQGQELSGQIIEKLDQYKEFRANKQFVQSDALRKEIEDLGYEVRDTENGPMVVKKFF
jgi:cysteinyl-tRNA synthetase